jgi:hypothetical protein
MDTKLNVPQCWEITGCTSHATCKVLQIAEASRKPCWEVVVDFDDYRSALNVCSDCIVAVFSRQYSLGTTDLNDFKRNNLADSPHHSCPGMLSS